MGKRNVNVNSVPMELEDGTTAGSLKKRLEADPSDWVYEKSLDGKSRYIPDNAAIPESASDLSIVPQYEYGGVTAPSTAWEVRQRLGRLEAEALFLARNRQYGRVSYDTEDASWFMVERLPIGKQWNVSGVSILIDIPAGTPGYPQLAPSWFWVDKDLRTRDGRPLAHFFEVGGTAGYQEYADKGWAHFCLKLKSWHPKTDIFFAQGDSLISFLEALEVAFHDRPRVKS